MNMIVGWDRTEMEDTIVGWRCGGWGLEAATAVSSPGVAMLRDTTWMPCPGFVWGSGTCEASQPVVHASALRETSYRCPLCSKARRPWIAKTACRCSGIINAEKWVALALQWSATQGIAHASACRKSSRTGPHLLGMRRTQLTKGARECGMVGNETKGCQCAERCWTQRPRYIVGVVKHGL